MSLQMYYIPLGSKDLSHLWKELCAGSSYELMPTSNKMEFCYNLDSGIVMIMK